MKKLILLFVTMFLISGITFADNDPKRTPQQRAEIQSVKLKRAAALTDDQTAKVRSTLEATFTEIDKARNSGKDKEAIKKDVQALKAKLDAEMKTILTDTQYQTYLAEKAKVEAKRKEKSKK